MSKQIAFTVGYAEGYDDRLANPPEEGCWKIGQHDDYRGGWVWAESGAAAEFLTSPEFASSFSGRDPKEFAVYRLELTTAWDVDVFPEPDEDGVYHLRNDARLVERYS